MVDAEDFEASCLGFVSVTQPQFGLLGAAIPAKDSSRIFRFSRAAQAKELSLSICTTASASTFSRSECSWAKLPGDQPGVGSPTRSADRNTPRCFSFNSRLTFPAAAACYRSFGLCGSALAYYLDFGFGASASEYSLP